MLKIKTLYPPNSKKDCSQVLVSSCELLSTIVYACVCGKSLQSHLTLYDPMDCSQPDFSVHRILQVRILEWVAIPSSRESFQPRDQTCAGRWHQLGSPLTTRTDFKCILIQLRSCLCFRNNASKRQPISNRDTILKANQQQSVSKAYASESQSVATTFRKHVSTGDSQPIPKQSCFQKLNTSFLKTYKISISQEVLCSEIATLPCLARN